MHATAPTRKASSTIRIGTCNTGRFRYGHALAEREAVASMGPTGDSYDNTLTEAMNTLHNPGARHQWFLEAQQQNLDPSALIALWTSAGKPVHQFIPKITAPRTSDPPRYDTAFDPQDGDHLRKGWAGRPH